MKKVYLKPTVPLRDIIITYTLCALSDKIRDDGLDEMGGYGGVDEEGIKEPDIKLRKDLDSFSAGTMDSWLDGMW